jgi:hypothetical protein
MLLGHYPTFWGHPHRVSIYSRWISSLDDLGGSLGLVSKTFDTLLSIWFPADIGSYLLLGHDSQL